MGLSVVIISGSDVKALTKIIKSVSFADEVIIVIDKKEPIPELSKKANVFYRKLENDFASQRNYGLSKCKNEWVLFVDDDENISPALAKEISTAIQTTKFSGFYLIRLDQYHGQMLRHGETGNMRILRLGKKTAGKFVRPVHEYWQIKGLVGQLQNPLLHDRGDLVTPFIDRMNFYGPIDALALKQENKHFSYWRLLLNPKAKFVLNYFLKLGFIDGLAGLFQAYLMSLQSLTVRVFQWQKN